jgi:hypothetical protein
VRGRPRYAGTVTAPLISSAVFLLACAGLWCGRSLAQRLPLEHLSAEARNSAQIGIGMIATLAALVMGLMVSSSKASFDECQAEVVRVATTMVLLDHALATYGGETGGARSEVSAIVEMTLKRIAPSGEFGIDEFQAPLSNLGLVNHLQATIMALTPASDAQRWFQSRAMTLTVDLAHERTLTVERGKRTIPNFVLVVVISWVALIFVGLGVFSVTNRTVFTALIVCAFAFASSIFLVLELDMPYSGLIAISGDPLRAVAAEVGRR